MNAQMYIKCVCHVLNYCNFMYSMFTTFVNEGTARRHDTHTYMPWSAMPSTQNHLTSTATQTQKHGYIVPFDKYTCDTCVLCLYFKQFFGIWANVYPHPLFWEITTTLSILKFYIIFFWFFLFFLWRQPCVFLFLFSNFAPWIIKITLLWSYRK